MKAILGEEQQLVQETALRMASNGISVAQSVLAGADWPQEPDNSLMADWIGLAIPEKSGGAGGSLVDLALVIRALAMKLAPTRYISHMIAMQASVGSALPVAGALSGEQSWCLASSEKGAKPFGPFAAKVENGELQAEKIGVPFGAVATHAIVTTADNQLCLAIPDRRVAVSAADPLAQTASLFFDNATVLELSKNARAGLLRSTVLVAADLCGVSQGAVDLGVKYAQDRIQFGKPIGAFQGVAHQLSDALVATETAWSLTLYACWAIESGRADAEKAAHAAKAKASEAAVFSAERALQVHGGIGMTWEASPHLFLRRAMALASWLGGVHWHRRRVGLSLLKHLSGSE